MEKFVILSKVVMAFFYLCYRYFKIMHFLLDILLVYFLISSPSMYLMLVQGVYTFCFRVDFLVDLLSCLSCYIYYCRSSIEITERLRDIDLSLTKSSSCPVILSFRLGVTLKDTWRSSYRVLLWLLVLLYSALKEDSFACWRPF